MDGSLAFRIAARVRVVHVPIAFHKSRQIAQAIMSPAWVSVSLAARTVRERDIAIKWVITATRQRPGPHSLGALKELKTLKRYKREKVSVVLLRTTSKIIAVRRCLKRFQFAKNSGPDERAILWRR